MHTDKDGEMINLMVGMDVSFSNSRLCRDRLDICLSLIEEDHHIRVKKKSRCLQSIVGSQTAQQIDRPRALECSQRKDTPNLMSKKQKTRIQKA